MGKGYDVKGDAFYGRYAVIAPDDNTAKTLIQNFEERCGTTQLGLDPSPHNTSDVIPSETVIGIEERIIQYPVH